MRETDFLDAVRLLVVDHAPGIEVLPAMNGSLHAIRETIAPSRAVDATGANLAPLLAREDGWPWVELPLFHDPNDPRSRRATATLEFPRPRGSTAATLALSLRSTEWGTGLFGHVLALQGRGAYGFWASLETDATPAAGAAVRVGARSAAPRPGLDRRRVARGGHARPHPEARAGAPGPAPRPARRGRRDAADPDRGPAGALGLRPGHRRLRGAAAARGSGAFAAHGPRRRRRRRARAARALGRPARDPGADVRPPRSRLRCAGAAAPLVSEV